MNDDVSRETLNMEIKAAKYVLMLLSKHKPNMDNLLDFMKRTSKMSQDNFNQNFKAREETMKDFVKKNESMKNVNIKEDDILRLKNALNKRNVNFSIFKMNNGKYAAAFQAKDFKSMKSAFCDVAEVADKAMAKTSILKKLEVLTKVMMKTLSRAKVKDKSQDLSL